MSSKTYIAKRRQLILFASKLRRALKARNKELIDKLSQQLNMLIHELRNVISFHELRRLLASAGIVIMMTSAQELQAQSFAPGQVNPFGLTTVYNGAWIDLGDLDGDGDMDVMIGAGGEYEAQLYYFENEGTPESPEFAEPVLNPFGIQTGDNGFSMPSLVDLDADGDLDLMVSFEYGLLYYENSGDASNPSFEQPQLLTTGYYLFSPTFADMDNDGDLDMMIGTYDYYYSAESPVFYYENTGSASNPEFAEPVANPFGMTNGYYFSFPELVDIDEDGDFDLFVGQRYQGDYYETELLYYENIGSAESPEFAEAQVDPFGLSGGYYFSYPAFADLDGDGDQDIFIGEVNAKDEDYGQFVYYENLGSSSVKAIQESADLQVFPNPASDIITIQSEINIKSLVAIDATGRQYDLEFDGSTVRLGSLPDGLITLRATDGDGAIHLRKVMIVR